MESHSSRLEDRLAERGGVIELLRIPSALFGLAASARSALFDKGWLPSSKLGVPVICVGNLTVGGTGKTPMVVWVARQLQKRGRRPGLLSRGYGGARDEKNDEALELERALPGVPHVQNPDRAAGGRELEKLGVDVIVMDDGYQHRQLARDLDLVLVDATRPWGLPYPRSGAEPVCATLPRGYLRESPAALARAQAVVLTRADQMPSDRVDQLRDKLQTIAPGLPIAESHHRASGLRSIRGDALVLDQLRGQEVDLLSAIGNPGAFERTVLEQGALVREHRRFPDHHGYTADDLKGLGRERPLITTAKDIVKCESLASGIEALYVLEIELTLVHGAAVLEALLDSLSKGPNEHQRDSLHAGLNG